MAFTFRPLDGLPEVVRIESTRHGDDRGWFAEVYKESAFRANGIVATFRQANHTMSAEKGTLRGLHYQVAPFAQGKLVRVISGEIFDVAVDIRPGPPPSGRWGSPVLPPTHPPPHGNPQAFPRRSQPAVSPPSALQRPT